MELQNRAIEINRLDVLARKTAIDAVEYAKQAGALLLEARKGLKHGQFLRWVREKLTVSERQAQRYMAVAKGKPIPIRQLTGKSDTVSDLKSSSKNSEGIWLDGHWRPEPFFTYLFRDDTGAYWVTASPNGAFHVCRHYKGERMSTNDFYWRYTIFSKISDPDFTSEFYIGTRFAITTASGIEDVLKSYGLSDLRSSFIFGAEDREGCIRPFGEPQAINWYWDSERPTDGLFELLKSQGFQNSNGAITYPINLK